MTERLYLSSKHRAVIEALLREHLPGVEVWAYGSRVNGRSHDGSDLDLVMRGPGLNEIPIGQLGDFEEAVRDSTIPFLVEARDWARLPERFHREIERGYVVLVGGGGEQLETRQSDELDGWHETVLGDLIDITHGFAFKGRFICDEPQRDVLLTPGNFAIGGGFKADKFKYYCGPVPDDFVLSEGDLIVSMTDLSKQSDTLGYPAFVPECREGKRYLHNQRLGKVSVKNSGTDARYIYYVMCGVDYRHEVLAGATGTTVKHTSPGRVKQFRFLLPPLPEQRAIAHILGTLDDKIELNRRMNETLEAMARALFKSWFVDFDPVRAKAALRNHAALEGKPANQRGSDWSVERARAYLDRMDPEIAALFPDRFVDSELGEIPAGWEVSTIGQEVDVVGGSTPSTKVSSFWNGAINWATPKDLASLNSPVLMDTSRKITESGLAKISPGLLPRGTVLLSSRAPIGYLAIADIPVAINQGFIAMKCQGRLSAVYVWIWTAANMGAILENANGSTFQEISKRNFRPLPVIVPSEPIRQNYNQLAQPLYNRIVMNDRQSCALASLRDALLPKLISGDLRVRNTEQFVSRISSNATGVEV